MGGAADKKCRKFLGFAPRELAERGRGAVHISFVQNGFEQSYIIPPKFDFQAFCQWIQQRAKRGKVGKNRVAVQGAAPQAEVRNPLRF